MCKSKKCLRNVSCNSDTTMLTIDMMTSSNGNIFRVTRPLCGEFTGPGEFPTQRPVTQSFDVFFDLRLNKRSSKQPWGWWFETSSWSLWRQCNRIRNYHLQRSLLLPSKLCVAQHSQLTWSKVVDFLSEDLKIFRAWNSLTPLPSLNIHNKGELNQNWA